MFFHTRSIRAVVFAIFIAFCNLATVTGAHIVHNSLSELFSASAGEIQLGPSNQIRAAATLGTALELTYDVNKCTVGTPRSVLFDASANDFEDDNENPNSFIEINVPVSRGIRVTDCSFGSEGSAGGGGLEIRGPTLEAAMYWRLREGASTPVSIGMTLNDVWGAAPLHIVISNNTFASGTCSVLRYAGALPPRSTVQITRNTFRLIEFDSMGFAANNQVPLGYNVGLSLILIRGHEFDGQSNLFFNCTVNITDSTLVINSGRNRKIDTPHVFLVGIPLLQSVFGSSSATLNGSKLLIHRNRVDTFVVDYTKLNIVGSVLISLGGDFNDVFIFESTMNISGNSFYENENSGSGGNALGQSFTAVVFIFSPTLSGSSSVVVHHNTVVARYFTTIISAVVWTLAGDQSFESKGSVINSSRFLIEFNEARLANTACAIAESISAVWADARNCLLTISDSSAVSISSNRLLVDGCSGNSIEKFHGAEIRLLRISVSSGATFTASNNSAILSLVVGAAMSIYGLAGYVGGSAEVAGEGSSLTLSDNVVRIAEIDKEVWLVSGCYFYMHSGGHINVTRLARAIVSNNTATVISTALDSPLDLLSYISGFSAELEAGLSFDISDGSWALIAGNAARLLVFSALSNANFIEGARLEASAFVLRGGSLTASDNIAYVGDSATISSTTATGVACVKPFAVAGFVMSTAYLHGIDFLSATAQSQLMLSRNTVVFDCPSCGASDVAGATLRRSENASPVAPCAVLATDSELAFVGNAVHIRPSGLSSELAPSTSNIMAVLLNLDSCK